METNNMSYEDFETAFIKLCSPSGYSNNDELKATQEYYSNFVFELLKLDTENNIIKFKMSCMYNNPVNNQFTFGLVLVDLFGTKAIDFDRESCRGCETCDYGSNYSTTLIIKDVSRNMDNFVKLVEKYKDRQYLKLPLIKPDYGTIL